MNSHKYYDEVMKLDADLRETYESIPQHLKLRPVQESPHDPANLIMERYSLELIYLKSQCVLHRKFIARGRDAQRYAYSRRTCIDACMEMLSHQTTLHHEAQPGGRLRSVKWFISSLTTNDFLLAAMIVCLDLYHTSEGERLGRKKSTPSPPLSSDIWAQDRRQQMMNAIRHCIDIWDGLRDESIEAYKASTTLRVTFEKLMAQQFSMFGIHQTQPQAPRMQAPQQFVQRPPNFGMFPNGNVADVVDEEVPPEHSAAMTLGLLSAGGVSPNAAFAANAGQGLPLEGRGYPASMAGLLDPLPDRGSLNLPYSGADGLPGHMTGVASPFSQFFGTSNMGGNTTGTEGGAEVDWVSGYIETGHVDFFFPLANMDSSRRRGTRTCKGRPWTPCKCGRRAWTRARWTLNSSRGAVAAAARPTWQTCS